MKVTCVSLSIVATIISIPTVTAVPTFGLGHRNVIHKQSPVILLFQICYGGYSQGYGGGYDRGYGSGYGGGYCGGYSGGYGRGYGGVYGGGYGEGYGGAMVEAMVEQEGAAAAELE
ncbi:hypothetical protein PCANC_08416 [Puccinia coronata f. sp. avenae]|uniref:Uncharacterized protein n=1 Tax=Puccinia coronata f. sp. avenae TaxID=200324 RepID=A0A2N5SVC1_9BASI|nr:hypothetical protein PCASD_18152 [Puccinia coronata f. sp. avenae]PLW20844.1 hypothetical protein PCANC_08233 [Puccinia coronata f. sp. avenae]PLW42198.1 hypothetical protein PCASD_05640 [Puccinia coronata f. sp. avenae]PLW51990.1 hypothetical protein PCANC_08416 [Puccinia coronata f. sp. avenae]